MVKENFYQLKDELGFVEFFGLKLNPPQTIFTSHKNEFVGLEWIMIILNDQSEIKQLFIFLVISV
jgi:hypothetical protein